MGCLEDDLTANLKQHRQLNIDSHTLIDSEATWDDKKCSVCGRVGGVDLCLNSCSIGNLPYMKKKKLSFEEFQALNLRRCIEKFPTCRGWSLNDWAVALAGEVGELCNRLKKDRLGDPAYDLTGVHAHHARAECLKELADVITYADLLMSLLHANTGEEIMTKFDEVSARVGFQRG